MERFWLAVSVLSFAAAQASADCSGWMGVQAPVRYLAAANRVVLVRDLDGDGAADIVTSGNQVDAFGAFSLLPSSCPRVG